MKSKTQWVWANLLAGLLCNSLAIAQEEAEPLTPGTSTSEIVVNGQVRSYLAHVPETYSEEEPVPLLVALHGSGGSAKGMLHLGRLERYAEHEGFIVVAPSSLGRAFNDGSDRGGPDASGVNDVAFIEAVIDHVKGRANIDGGQIFLAGFSSGASMAQRVALESSADIAAVFAAAGHLWAPERSPARGRPLLLMWGTKDKLNPMRGGEVVYRQAGLRLDKPPPMSSAAEWARRLGCTHKLDSSDASGSVRRTSWQDCDDDAAVELYLVEGLGHHWPGGRPVPIAESRIGPYSDTPNATRIMWEFFMDSTR